MDPLAVLQPANDGSDVRRATGLDQQHLSAILEGSRIGAFGSAPTAAELLATSRVQIAYVAGRPVGCIATTTGAPPLLHALIVVADERAKGHACGLIEAALADISPDCEVVWTAVDPHLLGAKERFAKHGFEMHSQPNHGPLLLMTRQQRSGGSPLLAATPPTDARIAAYG